MATLTTRLFDTSTPSHSPSPTPPSPLRDYYPYRILDDSTTSSYVPPSPFSSPSKLKPIGEITASPYRAPFEEDEEEEEDRNEENLQWSLRSSPYITLDGLSLTSPNRFAAPDIEEESEGDEVTESSLNMHGSFLPIADESFVIDDAAATLDTNSSYASSDASASYEHHASSSTEASRFAGLHPFPFTSQIYENYLRSPRRTAVPSPSSPSPSPSPSHSRSDWDEEDSYDTYLRFILPSPSLYAPSPSRLAPSPSASASPSRFSEISPSRLASPSRLVSPSRLISPDLYYLLGDLSLKSTSSTQFSEEASRSASASVKTFLAHVQSVQQEGAVEFACAQDQYILSKEEVKARRKVERIKVESRLREEEVKKEEENKRMLSQIAQDEADRLEREAQERREIAMKEEQERLEKRRREIEADRKTREEAERRQREALEKKKEEEDAKRREEALRKQKEEERRRKEEEEDRKQREAEERKRKEQEEAEKKKRDEEERRKAEEAKRIEEEKRREEEEERREEERTRKEEGVQGSEPVSSPSDLPPFSSSSPSESLDEKHRRKEGERWISAGALASARDLSSKRLAVEGIARVLNSDPAFTDLKRKATMEINLRVSQLCADLEIVKARTTDLAVLLREASVRGENMFLYCMNLLAFKIMKQTALVQLTQSAFPIGYMAVDLMQKFPPFVDVLISKFYDYCPYTIPKYCERKAGQSELEFRKELGYAQLEDNPPKLEEDSSFYARMEGAVRLYAAIIQTPPRAGTNPYGVAHGWTWLARIANLPPIDITATILRVFLEIAGYELLRVYKRQFHKLLVFFARDLVPNCPKESRPSDYDRLVKYLETYERTQQLELPQGRELLY